MKETHVFNEMGDEVENSKGRNRKRRRRVFFERKDGVGSTTSKAVRSSMKRYIADREGNFELNSILKFTKWHDGSSVSSAVADGEVLGATLYALMV